MNDAESFNFVSSTASSTNFAVVTFASRIFTVVTAFAAISAASTAFAASSVAVIVPPAISPAVIVFAAIFPVVTALSASFPSVTEASAGATLVSPLPFPVIVPVTVKSSATVNAPVEFAMLPLRSDVLVTVNVPPTNVFPLPAATVNFVAPTVTSPAFATVTTDVPPSFNTSKFPDAPV